MTTTTGTREQRRYSAEEQAEALTALAANNGNIRATAEQLDMPYRTLAHWACGDTRTSDATLAQEKRARLTRGVRKLTRRVLRKVLKVAASDEPVSLRDGMVSLGIALDKLQQLEAAEVVVADPELAARLELFRARYAASQALTVNVHVHTTPTAPAVTPIILTPTTALPDNPGASDAK